MGAEKLMKRIETDTLGQVEVDQSKYWGLKHNGVWKISQSVLKRCRLN